MKSSNKNITMDGKKYEKPTIIKIELFNYQDFEDAFIYGNAVEKNDKNNIKFYI